MAILLYDSFFSKQMVYNERKYTKLHFHNTIELYYLINGRVKYFIDNKSYALNKGDLIIVPNRTLHSTDSENCLYNERMIINFFPNDVTNDIAPYLQALSEDKIITIPEDKLPIIESMFMKIEDEFSKNKYDSNTLNKLYLNELLIYLHRYRKRNTANNKQVDALMQSISDYIFLNYNQDLSLSTLSEVFSLSESYISRKFKSTIGTSINEYINFVRVSKAAEIMQNEKVSITKIAMSCGFNDSNYFSTVFKKLKGVTPYKYMKTIHN